MAWWENLDGPIAGRYRIERLLGEGGMARVFLATDVRADRPVAFKTPKIEAFPMESVGELLSRFNREFRSQAADPIQGVIPIYESGEFTDAEGIVRPFLAMQYVPGGSLGDLLGGSIGRRAHRQTLAEVLDWLVPVARTLDRLHARRYIHRDVKPDNILFNSDGDPFLADLGIVGTLDPALNGSMMGSTSMGVLGSPGSPGYQSPESIQADPTLRNISASDQFSLAVTVYEALAGRLPADASTNQQWYGALLNWAPTPISTPCPELPQAAADGIMKAMSARSNERFASCSEFARALATASQAEPARAQPVAPPPPPIPPPVAPARVPPTIPVPAKRGRFGPLLLLLGLSLVALLGWGGYRLYTMRSIALAPELEALEKNEEWEQARNAHTAVHVRLTQEFSTAAGEAETLASRLNAELDLSGAAEQAAAPLLAFNDVQAQVNDSVDAYEFSGGDPAKLEAIEARLRQLKATAAKAVAAAELLSSRTALAAKRTTKAAQVPGAPAEALAADASVVALEQDVAQFVAAVADMSKRVDQQELGLRRYEAARNGSPLPAEPAPAAVANAASVAAPPETTALIPMPACSAADRDVDGVPDCRDLCETPARERTTVARSGCPMNASMRLFFPRDLAELGEMTSGLDEIVAEHKAKPNKMIAVSGYGDREEVPSVSQVRAEVVYNYLVEKGVPAANLLPPQGYGAQFASRSGDEAAMELDRRVEIQVEP